MLSLTDRRFWKRKTCRRGYTLLEVVLAVGIGLLVVMALYAALDVQMRYMQTGRNAVEQGKVARGILDRMAKDIRPCLAVLPEQKSSPFRRSSGGTMGGGTQPPASPPAETVPGDPMNPEATPVAPTTGAFRQAVEFGPDYVTLGVSTTPNYGLAADSGWPGGDIRYIRYYVEPGEGLVREVVTLLSGGMADNEAQIELLAPEVKSLTFYYFGQTDPNQSPSWSSDWPSPSTNGPPAAVRIVLLMEAPGADGQLREVKYSMVVSVPGAAIPQEVVNGAVGGGAP